MPFQLSPGVNVVEKDFTSIVPAVSSSVGGFAGAFRWGPIEKPTRVSSENELVKIFGAPRAADVAIAQAFFTAANFLSYTNNLLVVRANTAGARNAVALPSGGVAQGDVRLLVAGSGYTTVQTFKLVQGTANDATVTVNSTVVGNVRTITGFTIPSPATGTGYTTGTANVVLSDGSHPDSGDYVQANITAVGGAITAATLVTSGGARTTYPVPSSGALSVTFSAPQIPGGVAPTAAVTATDSGSTRTITGINILTAGSGYTSGPTFTIAQTGVTPVTVASGVLNAISATTTGAIIKNEDHYNTVAVNGGNSVGQFAAKYAGVAGNGLRVVVLDSGSWNTNPNQGSVQEFLQSAFSGAPGTSSFAESKGISQDEMHILVLDTPEGTFSGVPSTATRPVILEKYEFVSKLSDAKKSDGSTNYYKSVINSSSGYVWWMDHPYYDKVSNPIYQGAVLTNLVTNQVLTFTNQVVAGVPVYKIALTTTNNDVKGPLDAYRSFLTNKVAADASRQIRVASTVSNNRVFTVVSMSFDSGSNTYEITVAEQTVAEITTNAADITSVNKFAWGTTSDAIIASDVGRRMSLLSTNLDFTMSGGALDDAATTGALQTAFALFANNEEYDVSLIPLGNVPASVAEYVVANIAEVRKDCMVFASPNSSGNAIVGSSSTELNAIKAYRSSSNINSSYAVMDSGFKYQYDRYNDIYRWVPLNGDTAGLCARTDFTADPWFSPGGFNRGVVKNVVKLGFNPNQAQRDSLYAAGINPVVSFPGQGVILFGDKTLLSKPSAFDRINVRRLFIVLEKSIATAARFQLFEFNDDFTRAQFKNIVEPFLRDVQGRRGVVDFRVKCDETNNTGEVVDRNEFVADIFIKPNRSINFITLNFVAARSAVNFEEIGA